MIFSWTVYHCTRFIFSRRLKSTAFHNDKFIWDSIYLLKVLSATRKSIGNEKFSNNFQYYCFYFCFCLSITIVVGKRNRHLDPVVIRCGEDDWQKKKRYHLIPEFFVTFILQRRRCRLYLAAFILPWVKSKNQRHRFLAHFISRCLRPSWISENNNKFVLYEKITDSPWLEIESFIYTLDNNTAV